MVRAVERFDLAQLNPRYEAGYLALSAGVFADGLQLREQIAEDVAAAGLRVAATGTLGDLLDGEARALGDLVLIDVPAVDAAALAALVRVDLRAAHAGARLVVSTSIAALDDVFGCLDQSGAQILVAPSRAERVVALGWALADILRRRVREMPETDSMTLLRLTEQVAQLADRPGGIGPSETTLRDGSVIRFESAAAALAGASTDEGGAGRVRTPRPPLPDPRLVRRIIRQRQLRARFFNAELFADPAWDFLLDLTAARAEHRRVSVSSLCIASGVRPTTALRWIAQMTEAGLLERVEDEADRRRAFIALTDRTADAMARYFAELGRGSERLA